jgi:hypothetical protein
MDDDNDDNDDDDMIYVNNRSPFLFHFTDDTGPLCVVNVAVHREPFHMRTRPSKQPDANVVPRLCLSYNTIMAQLMI